MAETTYESKVCSSPNDAHTIYTVLSNLENLNRVKDLLPQDKVQELEISPDTIKMKIDGLGQKITIRLVDTIPDNTVKLQVDTPFMPVTVWIQLKEVHPVDTRIKLTLRADFPLMIKMMIGGKMQAGLDEAARMLAQFPYREWAM